MPDAENVRTTLAEILKSDTFREVLAVIYAEKGESDVPYPQHIYPSVVYLPQVYPCAEISLTRTRRLNPDDFTIDSVHDIDVYWHVTGSDELRLQVELERYVRAVEDFFLMQPHLTPWLAGCSVTTGDSDWSPLTRFSETQPLLKSAVISVSVRVQR